MSNKPFSRMEVADRRAQLLEVGCELFATRPYDEVWIDDVAAKAGVSRGLLYHYFRSKRGFLRAIIEHETAALLEATAPDPQLPPLDRLRGSVDAFFAYVASHPHGYRTLRGAAGTDSEVRGLVDANLERQEQRILDALSAGARPAEEVRIVVRGWFAFVIAVALDWLDRPVLDAAAIRELCVDTLISAVAAAQHAQETDPRG